MVSHGVAMRHEHINDAPEIIAVLAWFLSAWKFVGILCRSITSVYTRMLKPPTRVATAAVVTSRAAARRADQTPTIGNFRIEERLVEDARLPTVLAASITFARSRHSSATRPAAG